MAGCTVHHTHPSQQRPSKDPAEQKTQQTQQPSQAHPRPIPDPSQELSLPFGASDLAAIPSLSSESTYTMSCRRRSALTFGRVHGHACKWPRSRCRRSSVPSDYMLHILTAQSMPHCSAANMEFVCTEVRRTPYRRVRCRCQTDASLVDQWQLCDHDNHLTAARGALMARRGSSVGREVESPLPLAS